MVVLFVRRKAQAAAEALLLGLGSVGCGRLLVRASAVVVVGRRVLRGRLLGLLVEGLLLERQAG